MGWPYQAVVFNGGGAAHSAVQRGPPRAPETFRMTTFTFPWSTRPAPLLASQEPLSQGDLSDLAAASENFDLAVGGKDTSVQADTRRSFFKAAVRPDSAVQRWFPGLPKPSG